MFVLQAIEAGKPKRRFGVRRIDTVDFAELLNGAAHGLALSVASTDVAEAAQIDASQEAARLQVVRVALQDFLGFGYGVVNPLGLPVHFCKAFADDGRLGVQGIGFFVGLNGFGGVLGVAGVLILLLVDVAHRVVVIGVGTGSVFCGKNGFRVDKLLVRWRLRHGSGTGDTRQYYGKGNSLKVHRSPRN